MTFAASSSTGGDDRAVEVVRLPPPQLDDVAEVGFGVAASAGGGARPRRGCARREPQPDRVLDPPGTVRS